MVMWFNIKEARDFLFENRYVFTLRPKVPRGLWKRRIGFDVLSYNEFGKKGSVFFCWLKTVEDPVELVEYYDKSGFNSISEWWIKAKDNRELYIVALVSRIKYCDPARRGYLGESAVGENCIYYQDKVCTITGRCYCQIDELEEVKSDEV